MSIRAMDCVHSSDRLGLVVLHIFDTFDFKIYSYFISDSKPRIMYKQWARSGCFKNGHKFMMKDRKVFYRKVLWKKEHGKKSQKRKDFFYKKDVIYLFEILYF